MHRDRILVVDDDENMVYIIKDALQHEGYEVSTAGDGADQNAEKALLYDLKINVAVQLYSVYRASGEDGDIERENDACNGEDERKEQQKL